MRSRGILTACAVVLALLTGCVDSDDDAASQPEAADDPASVPEQEVDGDDTPARPMSGGSGSLVLGDQTIELQQVQCVLEPRDASTIGGDGQVLFAGQAFGVDAYGQDVLLEVSRHDRDSETPGDLVSVVIADFTATATASDQIHLKSRTPEGTVTVEGTTVRADGVALVSATTDMERTASFELTC